ncbi:flavin reductase family protein [Streptomyces sp. NPDC001508]|uniref:flavin reductase family protein n=1 Tax=Streptomyces sp. NPDC001508 TaxID=3154656 RepID=UPI00333094E2
MNAPVSSPKALRPRHPAVPAAAYRAAISHLPTGLSVVTAPGPNGPVGCTVTAVLSLSVDPPSLLVSFASRSRTLASVLAARCFAVNVLSWQDRALADQFATGPVDARFAGVEVRRVNGAPVLDRCTAGVVCEVRESVEFFDHTVVAGVVTWTRTGTADPAVLYRRAHHALLSRPAHGPAGGGAALAVLPVALSTVLTTRR